ncbi:MAG: adenosylcobinamide-GDP ribazoletransferase, partial [Nitrososphaera sp.]|nr:adenosylcobinamide-GDP ribazoletransferase [Nitrososphaera sp.]
MLRQVGAVFSFLTIIPTGSSNLQVVARHMYLFPVVGIAIG